MDTVEVYREMLSGMLDIYLSSVSISAEFGHEGAYDHRHDLHAPGPSSPGFTG